MRFVTELQEANELLLTYTGAQMKITMYSTSLMRIAIKLVAPTNDMVLYLVGVGCDSIKGKFYYHKVELSISTELTKETGERLTVIRDKFSSFELITNGGFSIAQGIEAEFGDSFDDFLQ